MLILYSLLIAITGFVYSNLLTEEGHIFHGLKNFLKEHLPEYLYKPVIGCERCVTGQLALWVYLYFNYADYNFVNHIIFISLSIFLVAIITKIWYTFFEKPKEKNTAKTPPEAYEIKKS